MPGKKGSGKSGLARKADVAGLVGLIKDYVLQETVGPLKNLAKRAAFALAGMVALAAGLVVLLLALLRVLQDETGSALRGGWNFAPYLLTGVVALVVIGVAAAIGLRSGSRGSSKH